MLKEIGPWLVGPAGIVIGWWLFILGVGFGAVMVVGWIFEYYRGIHAH